MGSAHDYLRADTEAVAIGDFADERTSAPVASPAERLVCVAGPDLGLAIAVGETLIVGRGADVSLSSTDVSRRHARLRREGTAIVVEDLASANGTFVNGVQITDRVTLSPGDRVQFATTTFVFARHDVLEERLQQLQKLESMNALVKGIAHDFNNMLTVIQAGVDVLDLRDDLDAEARATLDEVQRATTAAAALVRRLQSVGRNKPRTQSSIALAGIVQDAITAVRRLTPSSIAIAHDITLHTFVRGSREELHSAFLNLLLNARDALPEGGLVDISATVETLDRAKALAHHLPSEGEYVAIDVRDNGVGMDDATRARIFEPFFTTKGGNGSGLGLAMVFATIRNHGGAIEVESTRGRGTTFRLWLPSASRR